MSSASKDACFAANHITWYCLCVEPDVMSGHTNSLRCCLWLPQMRQVVSASDDKTVRWYVFINYYLCSHRHHYHCWNYTPCSDWRCSIVSRCHLSTIQSVKGTLHSKLTLGFFSWPKSLYYCDLSLTNCTFVKVELRVQGTCFYGDAGEFDGRLCINLGIWCQWLYGRQLDVGVV